MPKIPHSCLTPLFLLSFLAFTSPGLAQVKFFTKTAKRNNEIQNNVWFGGGYHQTRFLNETFFENQGNETLSHRLGYSIQAEFWQVFPFILDLSYFTSYFDLNGAAISIPDDSDIQNDGWGLGISYVLIPTSKYIHPYIGIGLLASSLRTTESEVNSGYEPVAVNTSGITWKAGLNIVPSRGFALTIKWEQSLPASADLSSFPVIQFSERERALRYLSAGIRFSFSNEFYN